MSRKGRPNMFILSNKKTLYDVDLYDRFTHDKRSNRISLNISKKCFDIISFKNKKYINNLTEKISFIKKNRDIKTALNNIKFIDSFKKIFRYDIGKGNNIYSEFLHCYPKVIKQLERDEITPSLIQYLYNYYSRSIETILSDLRFKSQMACIYGSIINGTSLNKISSNKEIEYILNLFKNMFYTDLELMRLLNVNIVND